MKGKQKHFILFEKQKLVYGRVPKVANSSIKAALSCLLETPPKDEAEATSDQFWKNGTNHETRMIGIREAELLLDTHFTFAFVRNPFDRLVSAYHNKIIKNRLMSGAMTAMGLTRKMRFPDFLEAVCRTPDGEMDPHLMPQSTMLVHQGRVIPGFVGRFERIDSDWKKLRRAMSAKNLDLPGELPRSNVRRDAAENLRVFFESAELAAMAASKYADDLKHFYPGLSTDQMLDRDIPGTWRDWLRSFWT